MCALVAVGAVDQLAGFLLATVVLAVVLMVPGMVARCGAVVLALAGYAVVKAAAFALRGLVETRSFEYRYRRISDFGDTVMDTGYERLQSPAWQETIDRASNAVFSAGNLGLEFQVNESLRLVSWVVTLAVGSLALGLLDWKALLVAVAGGIVCAGVLVARSRLLKGADDRLAAERARRNLALSQECDKTRCADIVHDGLLDWLLAGNRERTGRVSRLAGLVEAGRCAGEAVIGTVGFACSLAVMLVATGDAGGNGFVSAFLYVMLCLNMAGIVHGVYDSAHNLERNRSIMREWYAYLDALGTDGDLESVGRAAGLPTATTVELRGIAYRPAGSDRDILRDVDVTWHVGQSIAFVGANGAGKTTLMDIIAGLLRPTAGTILLDGRPVDYGEYQTYALARTALLPQDNSLFSLTIADNLRLGDDSITDVDLDRALRAVDLHGKVASLPHGADTYVNTDLDPDGTQLSGGQRRALLIARVMLHRSPVCILDEPTSALDPLKEAEFYDNMRTLVHGRTLMFVSHKIGTTRFCDTAYVLDHGTVVQHGDPRRLIDEPGAYRDLFLG